LKPDRVLPEDLVNLIIAADNIRRDSLGVPHSNYSHSRRIWIEPPFNILGKAFGQLQRALPWIWRKRVDPWMCQKMGGHAAEDNPRLSGIVAQTVKLTREVQRVTGQWPGVMILMSHPDTEGPLQWLRFELIRQGLVIAEALTEASDIGRIYKPHAQCFLAIDPFALDTVSIPVGAFYAAWMHSVYFAWDRQPSTQSWLQRRWLLRDSGYQHMAWRLLRRLRAHIPIVMAFSGGLPPNARLLYTAREFIQQLKVTRWPYPKRTAEKKLMEIVMQPVRGVLPAKEGTLPEETASRVRQLLAELGVSEADINPVFDRFKEEWKLAVPRRDRLLKILLNRLACKGKPLLLVAISHRDRPPHAHIAEPWALYNDPAGIVQCARGSIERTAPVDPADFARQFSKQFI